MTTPEPEVRVSRPVGHATTSPTYKSTLTISQKIAKLRNAHSITQWKDIARSMEGGDYEMCSCEPRVQTGEDCWQNIPGLIEFEKTTNAPEKKHFISVMDPNSYDDTGKIIKTCSIAEDRMKSTGGPLEGCKDLLFRHGSPNYHAVYVELLHAYQEWKQDESKMPHALVLLHDDHKKCYLCRNPSATRKFTRKRQGGFTIGPLSSEEEDDDEEEKHNQPITIIGRG